MDKSQFSAVLRKIFWLPLGIAAALAVVLVVEVQFLTYGAHWVEHTDRVVTVAQRLYRADIDQETGLRAYFITSDKRFLQPFYEGRDLARQMELQLRSLIEDDLEQQRRADIAHQAFEEWSAWADEAMSLNSQKSVSSAAFQLRGKDLMDRYRNLESDFIAHEEQLRDERLAQSRRADQWVNGSIVALCAVTAAVFGWFGRKQLIRISLTFNQALDDAEASAQIAARNARLEGRNLEVERANRLKSEFLASMSHELRTPLHTVIGFTELLLEEGEGPVNPKQKRFLSHIVQDSRHLLELINEILDLSKIEAGRLKLQIEDFDFSTDVTEALEAIRQQSEAKSIHIENRGGFFGLVRADKIRTKEILYNLLSNAVKFTHSGGTVWVESSSQDGFVRVTVGDTGVGIAPEEHSAVFDKFYQVGDTTLGVREGTGLGLAIAKQLIELQGGRISLESQKGQGSRFIFTLPLGSTDSAA